MAALLSPRTAAPALACLMLAGPAAAQSASPSDGFPFLGDAVSLADADLTRLRGGGAVVKVLPRADREVGIFAAVRVDAGGERLAEWVHAIDELKRSEHVQAVRRFSSPPQLDDLAELRLDEDDLAAIRRCRPGACDVKLSAAEMTALSAAADAGGAGWRAALQEAYRRTILARVNAYLGRGYEGLPPYDDQRDPVWLDGEFAALLARSAFLGIHLPHLDAHLRRFPAPAPAGVDSFLYWSKETLGGRPIVLVTHVFIARGSAPAAPEVVVASRQIYANHYMTGALAVTAITRSDPGRPAYLIYLNRSRVDVLSGFFGGLARRVIERRLRGEAADIVQGLRERLERAPPPR